MAETTDLRRGEWRLFDTPEGFALTIRPAIGPLSFATGLWVLASVTGALVLFYLAASLGDFFAGFALAMIGVMLIGSGVVTFIGFAWLAFGWTTLTVDADSVVLRCHRHLTYHGIQRFARSELRTLAVDRRWTLRGLRLIPRGHPHIHPLEDLLDAYPNRGPLRVFTVAGAFNLGGDISRDIAEQICATVLAREEGELPAGSLSRGLRVDMRPSSLGFVSLACSVTAAVVVVVMLAVLPEDVPDEQMVGLLGGMLVVLILVVTGFWTGAKSLSRPGGLNRSAGFVGAGMSALMLGLMLLSLLASE